MRSYGLFSVSRILTSVLVLSLAAIAISGCGEARKQAAVRATVSFVNGVVEARIGDSNDFRKIQANAELTMSDSIRTGEKSLAKVNFTDGTKIFLEERTTLNLKELKLPETPKSTLDIVIEIVSGSMFFDVSRRENSKFQMENSVAVAGVKGTRGVFSSGADGSKTRVTLISGRVEVALKSDASAKVVLDELEFVESAGSGKLSTKSKLDLAKERFAGMPLMKNINPDDFANKVDVIKMNK